MDKRSLAPADIVNMKIPNYAHGVAVSGAETWVHLSGQVGVDADGTLAEGFAAQTRQAFTNILACLRDADMTLDNVVMLRIYLINRDDLTVFRQIRGEVFGDRLCPSTLVFISGLVNPAMLVELEIVAAG